MLKYKVQTKSSLIARTLTIVIFIISTILLISLWGVAWFSSLFLLGYIATFIYLFFSLKIKPFECLLSDDGLIDVKRPDRFIGSISAHSFYNRWIVFLCVEERDPLLINESSKHNKPKKWFVVFNDSIKEEDYRLIARLIIGARWT